MPIIPYNRDIYLGEPIDSLAVNRGDQFNLGLNLYDDQGVIWPDGYDVMLNMYMSESDLYSGTGTNLAQFSGTTLSGSSTVLVTSSGTSTPGNYIVEIIISSGSGASDPIVSAGTFELIITGD